MISTNIEGIAFRVSSSNSNKLSPVDIINLHYSKEQELKDWVYFSTNIKQDSRLKNSISSIIFFFRDKNKEKYIIADVLDVICKKEAFIPEDSVIHSPSIFVKQKKCTWYKIRNIRVLSDIELKEYLYRRNDTCESEDLKTTLLRPRFSKCYFEKKLKFTKKLL